MSTQHRGTQKPEQKVIAVETKAEWTRQDVHDNKEAADLTKPLHKGTRALFDTTYFESERFKDNPTFVAIKPQRLVKDHFEDIFEDQEGWVQVPHKLLRVGVRIVKNHVPKSCSIPWKVGDLAICDTFHFPNLPPSIEARLVTLHKENGLETADKAYSIPLDCVEYGIERMDKFQMLSLDPSLEDVPFDQGTSGDLKLFENFYKAVSHDMECLRELQANRALLLYMSKTTRNRPRELVFALERGTQCLLR